MYRDGYCRIQYIIVLYIDRYRSYTKILHTIVVRSYIYIVGRGAPRVYDRIVYIRSWNRLF